MHGQSKAPSRLTKYMTVGPNARADRSALVEVVAQLNRLSPLQSVTAKKGTNALYTLSEFFDEQFRSECRRALHQNVISNHAQPRLG